jgi:hypothetical protein
MSPTVPPISTITTSAASWPGVAPPTARIEALISSVMWGITWTVRPR